MESIRHYQVNKAKNLSGCTLYLQLFYLDHVQWESGLIDRTIAPIDFWDSQKCSRVLLIKLGKKKDQLCLTGDVKVQIPVPMKHFKKDVPSFSGYRGHNIGHSTERKDNCELMVLKNKLATLRSIVVRFPDHVVKIIEKEAEKTRNTLIIEVKKMVESVISQRFVRTKEDENMMSMDKGNDFVETFIENIRKSCRAISKAKSAATSKGKRIAEEFDEDTAIGKELSPFEKDRHSSKGSLIKEGTPVTKGSSSLEATLKDLTEFCKKKMVPAMLKCEVVERKAKKSGGKKKHVLMDESTWYADFIKSNGFTVGPFKVGDEAACVEGFKGQQKQLGVCMNVTRMAREQEWSKLHLGDLKICEQMLVPVLLSDGVRGHWILANVKLKPLTIELWDSIAAARHKTSCVEATLEMLQTLDNLFLFDIKMGMPDGFKFAEFKINLKPDIPQQSNGTDCGLFVMKYMESIFLSELTPEGFNADDVRLKLLALIVCYDLNKVESTCLRECEEHFHRFVENGWQSKRDDHEVNLEGPVCSPKKSPMDPRFAMNKLKAQNMFTGTSPAHRT
ncbi:Ulp1 protease family, C-terminal catalytic domain containing protein [Parasponia andersonii]|uniref:Ulp1 protease family, C-terminal catalytic domain containing protein n=1 Tax=Parasponia andersonii TaxID=3476 RepID=A0A2P5C558_PARAD|nr:Ulp1 protease family, C-terminal catalytic domain containing protein [Parasponia andersonii]